MQLAADKAELDRLDAWLRRKLRCIGGFTYNQLLDSHGWVRSTDVKDMQVVFRARQIIYADGKREEYK